MYIEAVIVCVNFDDFLAIALPSIIPHVDNTIVLTSKADIATQTLADDSGCGVFVTDAFYQGGDAFNKGRALHDYFNIRWKQRRDWLLVLDADIVLPSTMRQTIKAEVEDKKCLYGIARRSCATLELWERGGPFELIPNTNELPGYFHLFHAGALPWPWYTTDYEHAGGYDSVFQKRFAQRRRLSGSVVHLGDQRVDWHGRLSTRWTGASTGAPNKAAIKRADKAHRDACQRGVRARDNKTSKLS